MQTQSAQAAQAVQVPPRPVSLDTMEQAQADAIENQKQIATEVLSLLHSVDPHAVVAGGAPRDWYMGYTATDIDVFFHLQAATSYSHAHNMRDYLRVIRLLFGKDTIIKVLGIDTAGAAMLDNTVVSEKVEDFANYMMNPEIKHVFELEYKGQTVQLIALVDKKVDVRSFAFNICQAWYDGKCISGTNDFKIGVDKKLIVQTGALYANGERYKEKMKRKFAGYTYVAARKELSALAILLDDGSKTVTEACIELW